MSVDVVEGRGLQLHRRVEVVGRWLFGGCSCLFAEWLGLLYKSRSASTLATAVRAIESMDLRIFSEVYDFHDPRKVIAGLFPSSCWCPPESASAGLECWPLELIVLAKQVY